MFLTQRVEAQLETNHWYHLAINCAVPVLELTKADGDMLVLITYKNKSNDSVAKAKEESKTLVILTVGIYKALTV